MRLVRDSSVTWRREHRAARVENQHQPWVRAPDARGCSWLARCRRGGGRQCGGHLVARARASCPRPTPANQSAKTQPNTSRPPSVLVNQTRTEYPRGERDRWGWVSGRNSRATLQCKSRPRIVDRSVSREAVYEHAPHPGVNTFRARRTGTNMCGLMTSPTKGPVPPPAAPARRLAVVGTAGHIDHGNCAQCAG